MNIINYMKAFLLPLASLAELIKRPIFWVIYPMAYWHREEARADKDRLVLAKLLWYVIDDNIFKDNLKNGDPAVEYCYRTKRCAFVDKWLPYDFARSFYWGAWRNNGINFMETTEDWIGSRVDASVERKAGSSFYEVRTFSGGFKLPYLEWWPWTGFRVQCGWISCGRFQVQARTYP